MSERFRQIGLLGKGADPSVQESIARLQDYLHKRGGKVLLEDQTAEVMRQPLGADSVLPLSAMSQRCDLVIVVGGDGTMLRAARSLSPGEVPLLGINRGRLGFLADVSPDDMLDILDQIFAGDYIEEQRCLLRAQIGKRQDAGPTTRAFNDRSGTQVEQRAHDRV